MPPDAEGDDVDMPERSSRTAVDAASAVDRLRAAAAAAPVRFRGPLPVNLPSPAVLVAFVLVAVLGLAGAAGWAARGLVEPTSVEPLPHTGALSLEGAPVAAGSVPPATSPPEQQSDDQSDRAPASITVHAAGAVVAPGVVRVAASARVVDVLTAAGGPSPDADLDRLNLAAPAADGLRVYVPRRGEDIPPAPIEPAAAPADGTAADDAGAPSAPIDLNRATAVELEELPGIGPTLAAAILEHRERHGPFRTVDGLLDVPGIGAARLAQLVDLVTVGR